MRALLVDDDPGIRAIIARILVRSFEQLEIVECENGIEALEALSRQDYALMLLDIVMPVMDGFDLLERVRRVPATANLPVIMMTGMHDEKTVRRILSVGVTDYVLKPVRPTQLSDRVSRILTRQATVEQPPAVATASQPGFRPLELSSRARVVVADGDPDFRQFLQKSLSSRCQVEMAASGVEAFQRCVRQPPEAIFVGSGLGLIGPDILVRQLRGQARMSQLRIIGVEPARTLVQARKRGHFEAVIPRSFVADVMDEAVRSLVRRPASTSAVLSLVPDLAYVAMCASEEALGVALGRSVTHVPAAVPPAQWTASTMALGIGDASMPVQLRISVATENVTRLGRLLGVKGLLESSEPSDEGLSKLVAEMGRLIAAELSPRGVAVSLGEPSISYAAVTGSSPSSAVIEDIALEFAFPGDRLPIRVNALVLPVAVKAGAA
jgi:DNA-binding response OmpR family regulator